MGATRRLIAIGLALSLDGVVPAQVKNLIQNGDFEAGGAESISGWYASRFSKRQPPAEVTSAKDRPHGGKRCASIVTRDPLVYTLLDQFVMMPPEAGSIRLEGWIRAETSKEGDPPALGGMYLIFSNGKSGGWQGGALKTEEIRAPARWMKITLEGVVPKEATQAVLRCGAKGFGRVSFDDLALTAISGKRTAMQPEPVGAKAPDTVGPPQAQEADAPVSSTLAWWQGRYTVSGKATGDSWISFSVPFPFEGQTPLALRVTSEPKDAVRRLEVGRERDNRPLRVVLRPLEQGETIKIRADVVVLLRDHPVPAEGVALAPLAKISEDVRQYLRAAPGVESEDADLKQIASGFSRSDLASLLRDLRAFLRKNLSYGAGDDPTPGARNQGAKAVLQSRGAVCTGYANAAAALLVAAGVPTRILACTGGLTGTLQEHYIIESWTPALGWARIEPGDAKFPWNDSENLIIRIVYPDSPRSPFNVPLYCETGGGATGTFDMETVPRCWQSWERIRSIVLFRREAEAIETVACAAFEALAEKSAESTRLLLMEGAAGLGERGVALSREVEQRIGP